MNENQFHLRTVTNDDAKILFEWRNDKDTRDCSLNTKSVEWESHIQWLEKSLKNANRILAIAENDGVAIGTCRADMRDDGFAEISYTLAPEWRGKRLSKPMVRQFVHEFLKDRRIAAIVKKDHKPSESVLVDLGMKPFIEVPPVEQGDPRRWIEWR